MNNELRANVLKYICQALHKGNKMSGAIVVKDDFRQNNVRWALLGALAVKVQLRGPKCSFV